VNTQNTLTARALYNQAVAQLTANGLSALISKLTQSDLVLEQQLNIAFSNYTFPVLTNNNGPANTLFNTEIRLNQQDTLIAGAWGFFLGEPLSVIDTTIIWHSYPNPLSFAAVGEAAALETIYNSYAQVLVNNDVVFPVWHMSRNRLVPQTQRNTAATALGSYAYDQIDLSSDGFFPLEPNLNIIGSKNTVVSLKMPAAVAVIGVAGFTRMRMHYRGLLAQNSTIIT
jgi:hypothetical protein